MRGNILNESQQMWLSVERAAVQTIFYDFHKIRIERFSNE